MSARPVIGVTTSRQRGWRMWMFNRLMLWLAGASAVRLSPGLRETLDGLDGFVVGGGDDIVPTLYGGEIDPAVRIDPQRDQLELRILDWAEARNLPVLGICRGAQMINVSRGGTLHNDIHLAYAGMPRLRSVLPRKRIRIVGGSGLHRLLRLESCRVNALHGQAVDRLGAGLRIVATDRWGMVQGIEATDGRFLLGVQWHPEFLIFNPAQRRLFQALRSAAATGDSVLPAGLAEQPDQR